MISFWSTGISVLWCPSLLDRLLWLDSMPRYLWWKWKPDQGKDMYPARKWRPPMPRGNNWNTDTRVWNNWPQAELMSKHYILQFLWLLLHVYNFLLSIFCIYSQNNVKWNLGTLSGPGSANVDQIILDPLTFTKSNWHSSDCIWSGHVDSLLWDMNHVSWMNTAK